MPVLVQLYPNQGRALAQHLRNRDPLGSRRGSSVAKTEGRRSPQTTEEEKVLPSLAYQGSRGK